VPVARLLLLNGPNLNLLGHASPGLRRRNAGVIEARLKSQAASKGHTLDAFQSNAEHELIQRVQRAPQDASRLC